MPWLPASPDPHGCNLSTIPRMRVTMILTSMTADTLRGPCHRKHCLTLLVTVPALHTTCPDGCTRRYAPSPDGVRANAMWMAAVVDVGVVLLVVNRSRILQA